jgi:hypothetical protein
VKTKKKELLMPFIKPQALGLYSPVANEKSKLAQQAEYELKKSIYLYRQLFYGLRLVAWSNRDKKATFWEALAAGELDQFKMAPGYRDDSEAGDGHYTKSEWDYDRLNAYMWNRFRERFDEAFSLEAIESLKTCKDIQNAIDELLEFALDNWRTVIVGKASRVETKPSAIADNMKLNFEVDGVLITGNFQKCDRQIWLQSQRFSLPILKISQTLIDGSWNTVSGTNEPIECLDADSALAYGQMLILVSRISRDLNGFMANPEGFLGIESNQARKYNLNLVKQQLLEINQRNYDKKQAEKQEEVSMAQVKARKQLEAEEWLANNQHLLPEEID